MAWLASVDRNATGRLLMSSRGRDRERNVKRSREVGDERLPNIKTTNYLPRARMKMNPLRI